MIGSSDADGAVDPEGTAAPSAFSQADHDKPAFEMGLSPVTAVADPSPPESAERSADPEDDEPARDRRVPLDAVAVVALLCGITLLSVFAVVLGHWSLHRIRRRERRGAVVARWALVLGYSGIVLMVLLWSLYFAVLAPEITLPR